MIINLIDDDVKFKLNQIIFELLLTKFQQTLSVKMILDNYRDTELWICNRDFHVMIAEIWNENLNDISIIVV